MTVHSADLASHLPWATATASAHGRAPPQAGRRRVAPAAARHRPRSPRHRAAPALTTAGAGPPGRLRGPHGVPEVGAAGLGSGAAVPAFARTRRDPDAESSALSGESALRLHEGGSSRRTGTPLRVVVATDRRPRCPRRVRVVRSTTTLTRVQWHLGPPRIRYEDAVIEVASQQPAVHDVVAELAAAVGSRRTTAARLQATVGSRSRLSHRALTGAPGTTRSSSGTATPIATSSQPRRAVRRWGSPGDRCSTTPAGRPPRSRACWTPVPAGAGRAVW